MGGPRAWYCTECRDERRKEAKKRYKQRKKLGLTRKLGSQDTCKYCGKKYVVESGQQVMCLDCKPEQYAKHDRESSIEFYHNNKEKLNPKRYKKRRIGVRKCEICGNKYNVTTKAITCSTECRKIRINKKQRERYYAKIKTDEKMLE